METLLCFVVGSLFAVSVFLLLQRALLQLVIGLVLYANAVNLLLFTLGRLTHRAPPMLSEDPVTLAGALANPLPQAFILTSIVISFGLFAFALALVCAMHAQGGALDTDALRRHDATPACPGAASGTDE